MSSKWMVCVLSLLLSGCGLVGRPSNALEPHYEQTDTTTGSGEQRVEGKILSAMFGLDNRMPWLANWRVCSGAAQSDGMPVVFDREVDWGSVQPGDFRVKARSGKAGEVKCVTLMPAADSGELRTALLVGELGSAKEDPPMEVEVVGHLFSKDGKVDYRGARQAVQALETGPVIVLAEVARLENVRGRKGAWSEGSGCPESTKRSVRVVWSGGVRLRDGDELGDIERRMYKVQLEDGRTIVPFAVGDLDDGDNNHLLCLDVEAMPVRVSFPAGPLVDPNRDPNPATTAIVQRDEPITN